MPKPLSGLRDSSFTVYNSKEFNSQANNGSHYGSVATMRSECLGPSSEILIPSRLTEQPIAVFSAMISAEKDPQYASRSLNESGDTTKAIDTDAIMKIYSGPEYQLAKKILLSMRVIDVQ